MDATAINETGRARSAASITLEDVGKTYPDGTVAVGDFTLEVRDAATGMGYGRLGRLLRVELPLALPGIVTGLRLATVSTVALVTVGSLIGQGGLGDLILGGFRNNFYKAEIVIGSVLCLALALVLDLLLAGLGRLLTPWARRRSA